VIAALRGASVAHARRALVEQFRAVGIESPELDARVLIGHALGLIMRVSRQPGRSSSRA